MAELKLRVSLDTSYLKGQISRLPLEFAGANVSIRPKFDRQAIVNEFRLLNRYIGSKKFNIVINTNLNKEIENADRLVKALGRVQQAASGAKGGLPIGTQVLSRTKSKGGFAAAEIKTLFGAAVQGGLIDEKTLAATRAQMVAALGSIGRDSIAGLLNGLKSGDADIQNAAKFLGNNLITSFKTVLGIASPSREFKKIGESAGQGFEQGLLKSIEIAEQSATRKMQRMLDRLARMALMMGGISGPEIGRQIAQARALPALNFSATTPRTSVAIGPSSTGRSLPPGASRPELTGTAFGRQKYLPTALGEELKEVLRGAANAFLDSIRQNIRAVTVTDMGAPPSRQGLLQGGSVAGFLPGRASAASVLELNNILAGAIREYFKSVAREIEYRSGSIGKAPISTTLLLAQSRVAGLLPQSVGRTPSVYRSGPRESQEQLFARRTREAYINSAARAADIRQSPLALPPGIGLGQPSMMRAPSVPPSMGGGAPPVPPRGGGGGSFGGGGFNVPNLPGAGLVRELGTEFGFAAKQVLLFGTAYKALAFIQGFPAQVGDAVGALQSFRNTLGAISPSAEEAAESSQFILDIVDKYNTPIQSARDGFTKLYASMKPTGFSGDEIRDLFLGISQAAATFGMSAEKVDRVNYAFAQMASKGQVMSEELKGQLGDVLPGAMGIFAEAAGFTGPDAITKFSKALEDGAYKGAAMKTLLTNVGIVMRKEFGPGAEGAARTFQGVINRMQNSFKLLYESFEPVAVGFLNSVVMPLTSGIKTLTDGFNAFFTDTLAKTKGGAAFAQQLNNLKPSFEGIRANLAALIPSFQTFGQLLLSVTQFLVTLAGNPIVGFLLKVYTNILLVNTAFTLLGGKILLGLIANIGAAIARLVTFNATMNALAIASGRAGTSVAGTALQMQFLQARAASAAGPVAALLGSLLSMAAIGAIAIAVTIVVNGLTEMREAEARLARLRGEKDPVGPSGPRPVATAARRYVGATKEKVTADQQKQQDFVTDLRGRLKGAEETLRTAQAAAAVAPAGGQMLQRTASANVEALKIKIKDAEDVLNLDLKRYPTQAERDRASVTTTSTVAGGGGAGGGGKDKGADDAKRLREEIARQAAAASDALFAEQQRLLILQQTNPTAAAITEYTSQELTIQRELNTKLAEAKSEKEKIDLKDIASKQSASNLLDLQNKINQARQQALAPIDDLLRDQKQQLLVDADIEKLLREGMSPERAKQVAEVRKLVRVQLEVLDAQIKDFRAALGARESREGSTEAVKALRKELQGLEDDRKRAEGKGAEGEAGVPQDKPKDYLGDALTSAEARLKELLNPAYQLAEAAKTIGDAFGEAFKGIITGSMTVQEAFAGLFQSIADRFADMVAEMIARWLEAQLIKGFLSLFPGAAPAAEASQAVLRFANGGVASGGFQAFANGGIASGGFTAFANGGMVTGPTMGLVGEGRYNEAIVPLPDGKSIPVELAGGGSSSPTVIVNVDAKGSQVEGNEQNANQLGRVISAAVQTELIKQQRPGGLLAR
jgi:tape measure domain-containing protein